MKKTALFLFLLTYGSFIYAQETVFTETCGNIDLTTSKKVDNYTGWDNSAPVTFTGTNSLDGYADVRKTTSTTNHVWFPSDKNSDLIISNIPAANYHQLKLSFDIAAYKLANANVNKLMVYCNETPLILPTTTFENSKFIPVSDIPLPESNTLTLKFQYSAENNTNGYRLDNFKITGEKLTDVSVSTNNDIHPYLSGNSLRLPTVADGTIVEIYDLLGTNIQLSALHGGSIELSNKIKKFLYLVRVNNVTLKIFL